MRYVKIKPQLSKLKDSALYFVAVKLKVFPMFQNSDFLKKIDKVKKKILILEKLEHITLILT